MRSLPLMLLLATPVAARAAERPAVAVVVLAGDGVDAAQARALRATILRGLASDDATLVDPLRAAAGDGRRPSPALAELDRGREELRAGRYRQASRELALAVAAMRASPVAISKRLLADATLELAAAQHGAGRRAAALRTLVSLLVWRPQHPLALAADPPSGWQPLLARARAAATRLPTGTVAIASEPPGAEAFVDGRRLGPTPLVARELREGTHLLSLHLEGHARAVVPLEVRRGEREVTLRLERSETAQELAASLAALAPALGERLPGLGELLAADRALFVAARAKGRTEIELRGFLYEVASGKRLARVELTARAPLRAEQLTPLALWRPASEELFAPVVIARSRPAARRPWYRKWWVWTLAGAAVAAATVGVSVPLALRARSSSPTSSEQLQLRW